MMTQGPCRGCLRPHSPPEPPFSRLASSPPLASLYANLLGLQSIEGDGLPENVCHICLEKITNAYELKLQCEKSEAVFKKYVTEYSQIEDMFSKSDMNKNDTILIVLPESEIMNQHDENTCRDEKNNDLLGILFNNGADKSPESATELLSIEKDESNCKDDIKIFSDVIDNSNSEVNLSENIKHECTMCTKSFISKGELKMHMRTHPIGTRHSCKICSCTYRKASILKRHYLTHTSHRKFICKLCSRGFYDGNALKAHMTYHQDKKHICTLCNEKFYFKHLLNSHLKTRHLIGNPEEDPDAEIDNKHSILIKKYDCTMCNETYSNIDDLKEHKKSHPLGTKHFCRICQKTYAEFSTLRRHMIVHTGKKVYLCTVCGKDFYFKNALEGHMIYHKEKNHECNLCDKKFHIRAMLIEHIRINHSNKKYNFMCEQCGKLCSSARRLKLHTSTHTKMTCPFCDKIYKNIRCYRDHIKGHDKYSVPKKSFICDYCGECRNLKTLLELHILSKHLKERRYICKVCNKGYFSKGSLNEHEVVHSRTNMVKCNVCGRLLVNKKAFILHNRLHTGEKPYVCNICGERFLSSSRRIVHQKSKHGERTECCTMCPSKFFLRSDLNKHMILHSKDSKKIKKN